MPVSGRKRVAKVIAAIASHFWTGVTPAWIEANRQPAVLIPQWRSRIRRDHKRGCPRIDQIMWIMRPSKLTAFNIRRCAHRSKRAAPQSVISRIPSDCSALSQIGRLSGHSNTSNLKSASWCLSQERSVNYAQEKIIIFVLLCLIAGPVMAQESKVTSLISKDLRDVSGKEGLMITVDYAPGG